MPYTFPVVVVNIFSGGGGGYADAYNQYFLVLGLTSWGTRTVVRKGGLSSGL